MFIFFIVNFTALRDSIEIYAWAPKPYHKFMAFKSFSGGDMFSIIQLILLDFQQFSTFLIVDFKLSWLFHTQSSSTSQCWWTWQWRRGRGWRSSTAPPADSMLLISTPPPSMTSIFPSTHRWGESQIQISEVLGRSRVLTISPPRAQWHRTQ